MQASTKQVRKVMRNAIIAHAAQARLYGILQDGNNLHSYTEKTSDANEARRSVVYTIDSSKASAVLQQVQNEFAVLQYSNKVKTTCDGLYLRCIADIA